MFCIDATFDGMASDFDIALAEFQLFAGGHANLFLHKIHAGDHFSHRVLHLDAGIHLDEVELAAFKQEFEGAGAAISDALAGLHAAIADAGPHARGDVGGRRFFHDLLVPALHRAVTLAKVDDISVFIGQYLNLDVARILQVLLHVQHRIAKCGFRL